MTEERSINEVPPYPLDSDKENKIPIGDRNTIFLNQLFTNYFFLNLPYVGIGKTIFVNFSTTKQFSFSLWKEGNRHPGILIHKGENAKNWGLGTVRNLEKYFEDNEILNFEFTIHKANSGNYYIDIDIIDPLNPTYKVIYDSNGGYGSLVERGNQNYIISNGQNAITKPYNIIKQWKDINGNIYNIGDIINLTQDLVLYADWRPVSGKLTYRITVKCVDSNNNIIYPEHFVEIEDGYKYWVDPPIIEGYTFQSSNPEIPFEVTDNLELIIHYV